MGVGVERVGVSRMRDFFITLKLIVEYLFVPMSLLPSLFVFGMSLSCDLTRDHWELAILDMGHCQIHLDIFSFIHKLWLFSNFTL